MELNGWGGGGRIIFLIFDLNISSRNILRIYFIFDVEEGGCGGLFFWVFSFVRVYFLIFFCYVINYYGYNIIDGIVKFIMVVIGYVLFVFELLNGWVRVIDYLVFKLLIFF